MQSVMMKFMRIECNESAALTYEQTVDCKPHDPNMKAIPPIIVKDRQGSVFITRELIV